MRLKAYTLLIFLFTITACDFDIEGALRTKSYFDRPFPGWNKNLEKVLGSRFSLICDKDTSNYEVIFERSERKNVIRNLEDKDTIFHGFVSRYKDLHYFSQSVNDTAWHVFAVEVGRSSIKGFGTLWEQMYMLDNKYEKALKDKNQESAFADDPLFIKADPETETIYLHADKQAMGAFYESLLNAVQACNYIKE